MSDERSEEREPGQHPNIHEQAEPAATPRAEDTNEYADDRAEVLQPDGEPVPVAGEKNESREGAPGREDS
jgi:hypothetical protein